MNDLQGDNIPQLSDEEWNIVISLFYSKFQFVINVVHNHTFTFTALTNVPCITAPSCCHHDLSSLQKTYWESVSVISLVSTTLPGGITTAHPATGVEDCILDSQTTKHFAQWTPVIVLHSITCCHSQSRSVGFRVHCWRNTTKRGRSSDQRCCRLATGWLALLAGATCCWEPTVKVNLKHLCSNCAPVPNKTCHSEFDCERFVGTRQHRTDDGEV